LGPKPFRRVCDINFISFPTGPLNAGITQTTKFKVLGTGQSMTLECEQDTNHNSMYWYQQDHGHGLRLIHYSVSAETSENGENFLLKLLSATPSQTSCLLSAQKKARGGPAPRDSAEPSAHSQPQEPGSPGAREPCSPKWPVHAV
uniref:Immunoglobulin V-set domain-containing protein n=1 Tax=Ursus maritimus TaxID=29073 RepID=A0A452U7A5_URSMA